MLDYKFRQFLINKSELFSDCKVIECDESYTCKTCGYCGVNNDKLGGSKAVRCKQENCQQKYISSDRNIHATRSILLRYLTRNNVVIRETTRIAWCFEFATWSLQRLQLTCEKFCDGVMKIQIFIRNTSFNPSVGGITRVARTIFNL